MDFSEVFPFAASLLNCLCVCVKNVNIVLKNGEYPSTSPFSLGLSLKSFELSSPIQGKSNSVGDLCVNLNSLSIFWNYAHAKDPCYLLHDFCVSLELVLLLKRIEQRRLSFFECIQRTSIPDVDLQKRLLDLSPSSCVSFEEFLGMVNPDSEDQKMICKDIWVLYHNPRPIITVNLSIGLIDCKLTKQQYLSLVDFGTALSRWTASDEKNEGGNGLDVSEDSISDLPALKETPVNDLPVKGTPVNESTNEKDQDPSHSSYRFSILTVVFGLVSFLFSSYSTFLCFIGCILSLPYLLIHSFFRCLFFILIIGCLFGLYYLSLRLFYQRLNKRTNRISRMNDLSIRVNVEFKGIHLELVNDEMEESESLFMFGVEDLECTCDLNEQGIQLHLSLDDLFIRDGPSSVMKKCERFLLTTDDINDQGDRVIESHIPFIDAVVDVQNPQSLLYGYAKKDIDVNVTMSSLNLIISPYLIQGILRFVFPLPFSLSSSSKDNSSVKTLDETPNETPVPTQQNPSSLRIGVQFRFKGVHCVVDTEKETSLLHLGVTGIGADIQLNGPAISLQAFVDDLYLRDCTNGTTCYNDILCISHERYPHFIDCSLDMNTNMVVKVLIAAPVIIVRMRFIRDVLLFVTKSMLTDCVSTLLKSIPVNKADTKRIEPEETMNQPQEKKEMVLPLLSVTLEDAVVRLPRDSESSDSFFIHLGEISVLNKTENPNEINVTLKDLTSHCIIQDSYKLLIPGITLSVGCLLGTRMNVTVDLSPLFITVGEQQVLNLLHLITDNLSESSYLYQKGEESSHPAKQDDVIVVEETPMCNGDASNNTVSESSIHVSVMIHAIGVEYFTGDGGYGQFESGSSVLSKMGSVQHSLIGLVLNETQVQLSLVNGTISLGLTLSSLDIRDTRVDSPITPNYKSLIHFGDCNSPAIGMIMKISKELLGNVTTTVLDGHHKEELVNSTQLSVYLGQLSIVPSPFIFSFLDLLFPFINALLKEITALDFSCLIPDMDFSAFEMGHDDASVVHYSPKEQSLSTVGVDVHFEHLSLYCVEDCTIEDCPVFLVCLGLNACVTINPWQDISVVARLTDLRCCRSNNSLLLQPPDMKDAVSPFNLTAHVSLEQKCTHITASVEATKLLIRLGVLDAKLLMNFVQNLIPKDLDPSRYSVKIEKSTQPEPSIEVKEEEKKEMVIQANVGFEELVVIFVNDSLKYELPVIEFDVTQIGCGLELADNMNLRCGLTIHGNYYRSNSSIWEPYLESSTLSVALSQENGRMSIDVSIPQLIQLNISSALISAVLSAIDPIMKCSHSRHRVTNGCYVSFVNYTGENLQYSIDNDGGMNDLLRDSAVEYQTCLYQDVILYQNMVLLDNSNECAWVEIHYASPHFILYRSIPAYCSDAKHSCICQGNKISKKSDCYVLENMRFRVIDRIEEFSHQCMSVMNQDYVIPLSIPEVESIHQDLRVDVYSQPVPSALPTHPSLALIFLNREYTILPKRSVSLFLNDFDPIQCEVDEEKEVYLPFTKGDLHFDTVLRNTIVGGRKMIQLASPISIQNCSNRSIFIQYMNLENEVSSAFTEIQDKEFSYCPLSFTNQSAVHMSLNDNSHVFATIEMEKLKKSHLPSCVNVGTKESPYYVRLIVTHKTVYDFYNKQSIDTTCLRIVPVLLFKNMLPACLDYRFVDGSKVIQEGLLKEGENTEFSLAPVNPLLEKRDQSIRIRIRPEGSEIFSLFDESILPSLHKTTQSTVIYDKLNLPLRLSYNCFLSNQGIVTVELYCDYWIVNKTNMDLTITEKKETEASYRVVEHSPVSIVNSDVLQLGEDHSLKPYLFACSKTDPSNSLFIRCEKSHWSEKVGIGASGTSGTVEVLPDTTTDNQQKNLFGVSIVNAPNMFGLSKMVIISPSMLLMNHTDIPLEISQSNTSTVLSLTPNVPQAYQWTSLNEPLEIRIRENSDREWSETTKLEVGEHKLLFPKEDGTVRVLRVNCVLTGEHLNVVFDFVDSFNQQLFLQSNETEKTVEELIQLEDQEIDKTEKMELKVNVKGVGVSVIDSEPKEVLYLLIEDIVAGVTMYQDQSTGVTASISRFQIDNSIPGSKYPVMLGSLDAGEKYTTETGEEKIHNLIEVSVLLRSHPSFLFLEYCGFMLLPLQLSIDSATIVSLLSMVNDISVVTETWNTISGHDVLINSPSLTDELIFVCPPNESYCYCGELLLQPIVVRISVVNNPSQPLSADLLPSSPIFLPFRTLINTALSLIANLQNASLQLNSFLMQNQYLSMSQFVNKLVIHYVMQVISKLYLLLGAFNVVGNPVELVGNIYEGVSAFFFEPMESLMKKPSDFFSSVGSGTSKLLSMTTYGVLDSVSKITDTVSNGIASLSLSESYQADRAAGKTGFIHGVKSGVTGLYKDTKNGMEEKGFVGAAAGFGKALTGLVINPLSGAASSVTNAVNNVKHRIHKEKQLEVVRPSRYIPLNKLLLTYNYHLSYGNDLLHRVYRETSITLLPKERYVCHCEVDDHSRILLLTTNKMMLLSMNCQLLWFDDYNHITLTKEEKVLHVEEKAQLSTVMNELTGSEVYCRFEVESEDVAVLIYDFVQSVLKTPVEHIATFSLQLVKILSSQENSLRFPPDVDSLAITSVQYVSRTIMLAGEGYNEDTKRKHVMYKVEVQSKSDNGLASWNVYFRYTALE